MGGEGVDDLAQRKLHIAQSLHGREMQEQGFGATTDAGDLLLVLVIAPMEVTELLVAQGGSAAKEAALRWLQVG